VDTTKPAGTGLDPGVVGEHALGAGIPPGKQLPAPADLEETLPLDAAGAALVARTRREIAAILAGQDDRLLVLVGPCSIHDPGAALAYARLLAGAARAHAGELLVVMRVYFEKPRTVTGWKGFVSDPRLDGSFEVCEGIHRARELLIAITRLGLAAGTEFLDPILGQFYADMVSFGVIGARTVESQIHRGIASGLAMPVGFKNRTDGDIGVAVDAIRAARSPHWLPTLTQGGAPSVKVTGGNERTHLILRGGTRGPNFSSQEVRAAVGSLLRHGLSPHLIVDCSHANSGKDPARQPGVAAALAAQLRAGERAIAGVMIESNLLGGSQDPADRPLVYGQSITDGCLEWDATVPILGDLAQAVAARRPLGIAGCAGAGTEQEPPDGAAGPVAPAQPPPRDAARLRVIVADDEAPARARLLALLPKDRGVEVVGEYETGTETLEAIRRDRPDIAFLDMQMPGCDGLQVVAGLAPDERPVIVFVTAHERFAVEAFEIRAADYVLKPFDRKRLSIALDRAAEFVQARRTESARPPR
jgi:3-deoxy-7-phosphoheptulonate synthase